MSKELKRSVTIAGHNTSLSLEPEFWEALRQAARQERRPVAAIIGDIDGKRGGRNLSSAIRVWLLDRARRPAGQATVGLAAGSADQSIASGAKGSAK
jgi:predicted DNA-binding ribbon-helix-helix protein